LLHLVCALIVGALLVLAAPPLGAVLLDGVLLDGVLVRRMLLDGVLLGRELGRCGTDVGGAGHGILDRPVGRGPVLRVRAGGPGPRGLRRVDAADRLRDPPAYGVRRVPATVG
jgi:hypothetical protein